MSTAANVSTFRRIRFIYLSMKYGYTKFLKKKEEIYSPMNFLISA